MARLFVRRCCSGGAGTAIFRRLSSNPSKTLIQRGNNHLHQRMICDFDSSSQHSRGFSSETQKAAFDGIVASLLRNEIQYELDTSPPPQLVQKFNSFKIDDRPGEQWIILSREFGDNDNIKIEAPVFDCSTPVRRTSGIVSDDEIEPYIPLVIEISKRKSSHILEFECFAWTESMEIKRVTLLRGNRTANQPYNGPPFKELDDALQQSFYDFLAIRGISNDLAVFVHEYVKHKYKCEYIRWMENVKFLLEN